jgi:formyl-CoA transferase
LIQAESGLSSITGGPDGPARVGVSLVDIGTGLHAYEAILEALLRRAKTGEGADIRVSMFDAMMEWMTVPLLFGEYGEARTRTGLTHFSLAPYGVFQARDGHPILIAIQSDREWKVLCSRVLGAAELGTDPRFATNPARIANRAETDGLVARYFAQHDVEALSRQLDAAEIAFARVNEVVDVLRHPHLRRVNVGSAHGAINLPAPPARFSGEGAEEFGPLPALGEHTERVRREFLGSKG